MDNKQIYAIIAVIIIVVAAVGVYFALGNNGGENSDDDTPDDAKVTMTLNGVVASEENVLNGTYPIQRNLVLVTNGEPTGNVAAFLSWVTSEEGQTILGEEFVKLTEFTTEIQPDPNGQTTIALGGSTSLSETMDKLTRAYMEKYDFMELTVQGGGSGAGESQCHSGEFDIGMLSRDLSQKYADMGLKPITIGQDGVAVIANIEGVSGLTGEQVLGIFSGEIKNWSEVGGPNEPIRVVIREDGSGTRDCFDSYLEGLDENFVCTQAATVCQATGTVITNVQNTYGAIGYISIGQVPNFENADDESEEPTVKGPHALQLNNVVASEDNVLNGTYPIQRNLVLVTNGEPTGNVAAFLSWVTSEEGQTILGEEFVKLTEFTTEVQPDPNGQTTIALGGSTSLSETMDKLIAAYMEKYDFMELTVQGGGSGAGESQCHSGEFDIGMLSRDLSQKYADMGLKPITIGQDGVAVIANIDGVVGLTAEQVLGIFSGEIKNWSEVGGPNEPIRVVIREDGSGTRDCFDSYLEGLDENFVCTQAATVCQATGTVITNVQNTYGAIGYISIGQVVNL